MNRWEPFVSTVSKLPENLLPAEDILLRQDGVGLYDGRNKAAEQTDGRLHLTTHRLIYLHYPSTPPNASSNGSIDSRLSRASCALDLHQIIQTEFFAGFLKSSPKITLLLRPRADENLTRLARKRTWQCRICSFTNALSLAYEQGRFQTCGMCGVQTESIVSSEAQDEPAQPEPGECPTCTYLNAQNHLRCEMCSTVLPRPRRPSGADTPPDMAIFVRLSFRQGGSKPFYAALKTALSARQWEARPNIPTGERNVATVGIDGLLKAIDLDSREEDRGMQDALRDLEALKIRAQEMIGMARAISAKLTKQAAGMGEDDSQPSDEQISLIRSTAVNLGLPAPAVTAEMVRDEQLYHQELAAELVSVLFGQSGARQRPVVMRNDRGSKGIITLDEAWCIWNRARGVSLVSPKDMMAACEYLDLVHGPRLRTFASGLKILHMPVYTNDQILPRILADLTAAEQLRSRSTLEIAQTEQLTVTMAAELLDLLETETGQLCHDGDLKDGKRWYPNLILSPSAVSQGAG
ncbi:uncharacterized protein L969DRAFT_95314 [Mixia osmundae IAM 14324]|uniref:Vacuolar protein-sorting-associated protein 36 n=1 Tax=Mixia osmundae (strain CBS 9802 / IAM 14324 / JCM 22182 / KY 12970) TaxID=764103 RepID=G7DZ04_MIXOS|nr:uncharacterized protein L969DRAFT_95314 [Mixia osmundae IAM 14324]KEI38217.1 hypothetical protein L969DRAFT_95314 [Mixia osmundae IAM 14324]GAA95814.1 hypothetical protein E5Q_02471 [Mixia osmundae IAM 14324]